MGPREVGPEACLGEAPGGVAAGGVERPPAAVVLAPGDRVVQAHRAAGVGALVHRGEHVRDAADGGGEVVPLVGPLPVLGQALAGRVDAVGDLDRRLGDVRGPGGAGADDVGEELPVGLGLDGRVDPDEAAALLEEALKDLVLEPLGVVGGLHGEVEVLAELADRGDAGAGRGMLLAGRLGEYEHSVVRVGAWGWCRGRGGGRQSQRRDGESDQPCQAASPWKLLPSRNLLRGPTGGLPPELRQYIRARSTKAIPDRQKLPLE
jgi:hypothetical protein